MFKHDLTKSAAIMLTFAALALPTNASAQRNGERYFDGLYLGAEGGYARLDVDVDLGGIEGVEDLTFDDDALYYGAFLGWRRQLSSGWVVGFEARLGDSTGKTNQTLAIMAGEAVLTIDTDLGRHVGGDVIVGHTIGSEEDILLFASAGYANVKFRADIEIRPSETTDMIFDPIQISDSDGEHGYRLGGGAEFRLTDNLHLRATGSFLDADNKQQFQLLGSVLVPF